METRKRDSELYIWTTCVLCMQELVNMRVFLSYLSFWDNVGVFWNEKIVHL
jgi:hypothetical protein